MGRGHGAAQRFVLSLLGENLGRSQAISNVAWDWMHHKGACGCAPEDFFRCSCEPNANEVESIRRAVRSLEREGLVRSYWEAGEANPYKKVELSARGIERT
jgi:hypothetical protein